MFTRPDKQALGLRFEDRRSPQTPCVCPVFSIPYSVALQLLKYSQASGLKSSFAVVGDRNNCCCSHVLHVDYVAGHHIVVHTYRPSIMTHAFHPGDRR